MLGRPSLSGSAKATSRDASVAGGRLPGPPPAGRKPPPTLAAWQPQTAASGREPAPRQRTRLVFAAVLIVGLSLLSVTIAAHLRRVPGTGTPQPQPLVGHATSASSPGTASLDDLGLVASTVAAALVDVNATLTFRSGETAGTGIVLNSSGLVLTNNHVVNGASAVSATDIGNGQTYSATVLGYDRDQDVALLQLNGASALVTARLGDSSRATVGEALVAIGNAGGVGGPPRASGGSLVALDQQIIASDIYDATSEHLSGMIETDAAMQPGDSGGPLADSAGQVIGIDTATSNGYSLGSTKSQGFAIPINTALAIAKQIASQDASAGVHVGPTAFLGVGFESGSPQEGSSAGLGGQSGTRISGVVPGSPAALTGLVAGDTIVSLDGQAVASPTTLTALLGRYRPGDRVEIRWADEAGAPHATTVQLAAGPAA